MKDYFKEDQADWWNDYVAEEVYKMQCEFDMEQAKQDENFEFDIPF